jgi:hypothetical protein
MGEFNRCGDNEESNFNLAIRKLSKAGFSADYVKSFKIILWDIPNDYYGKTSPTFEDFADAPNFFYLSGYDPSAIAFILGTEVSERQAPRNAQELFEAAMDQSLLNRLIVVD